MTIKPKEGYTAERFCEFYPKRMEAAIDMLAKNEPITRIAKKVRARTTTIHALKYRKIKEINERKKALAEISFESAMEAAERARAKMPDCTAYQLTGMHGIFRDTFNSVTADPVLPQPPIHVHIDVVAQFKEILAQAGKKVEELKQAKATPLQLPAA